MPPQSMPVTSARCEPPGSVLWSGRQSARRVRLCTAILRDAAARSGDVGLGETVGIAPALDVAATLVLLAGAVVLRAIPQQSAPTGTT